MATVTLQESTGVTSAVPEPVATVPPATTGVSAETPYGSEFECDWALDGAHN